MLVKDMKLGRRADPEREALVTKLASATTRLDDLRAEKGAVSLSAARGDKSAIVEFLRLENEIQAVAIQVETFTLAIESFDRSREAAKAALQAERAAKAAAHRKAMIDMTYAEQKPQYEAAIARFKAQGNKQQVKLWSKALATLREDLEAQHAPKGAA